MTYGNVYVAQVALGAKDAQTVERLPGGRQLPRRRRSSSPTRTASPTAIDMTEALDQQKLAVESGYWPLFRYDPRRIGLGESPLKLDSAAPKLALEEFTNHENRFQQVKLTNPDRFKHFMAQAQVEVREKFALYEQMARALSPTGTVPGSAVQAPPKARA